MQIKDGFAKKMSACYKKEICMSGFIIIILLLLLMTGILFTNKLDDMNNKQDALHLRVEYLEEVLEYSNKFRAEADSYLEPLMIGWEL